MDSGYSCLAWVLPTLSNVRLTPCQNQQAFLLCRPSSLWSQNPSWKPQALLSKPTEAVWDYMCGIIPTTLLFIKLDGLCKAAAELDTVKDVIIHTDTPQQQLYFIKKWLMMLCDQHRINSRKMGEFGKWQVYWTQIEWCMPHSFLGLA